MRQMQPPKVRPTWQLAWRLVEVSSSGRHSSRVTSKDGNTADPFYLSTHTVAQYASLRPRMTKLTDSPGHEASRRASWMCFVDEDPVSILAGLHCSTGESEEGTWVPLHRVEKQRRCRGPWAGPLRSCLLFAGSCTFFSFEHSRAEGGYGMQLDEFGRSCNTRKTTHSNDTSATSLAINMNILDARFLPVPAKLGLPTQFSYKETRAAPVSPAELRVILLWCC
ncbi:hypothetical protein B0T25DRAFT_1528 [Lasiosphaeria hispida]|uniref:Uncharacterized protein n=1 Tax=Lasiosphaeria hispida TaxID=260671 RepID=A0AAJ0HT44_9PEZI|nr:hypothetical protein B0T25DRAFT_1528 [Lasiosphaeria hispida]